MQASEGPVPSQRAVHGPAGMGGGGGGSGTPAPVGASRPERHFLNVLNDNYFTNHIWEQHSGSWAPL